MSTPSARGPRAPASGASAVRGAMALLMALSAPAAAQTGPAAARTIKPLPFRSGAISFRVHVAAAPDFTGHVTVDSAAFTGTSLADVRGSVLVRADSMKTGIGLRDHHMRGAMEAKKYPDIRFELLGVAPRADSSHASQRASGGDTVAVTFAGRLTIHGVTRDDTIPGTVVLGPDSVVARAAFPLDMRDYGIKPPTRLLVIRVQPVVEITVRLTFAAATATLADDRKDSTAGK